MNSLNSILIEGNMVREPNYRTTPKGTSVCTFSLASNRFFKQDTSTEKEVSFFEVETWSKVADSCNNLGKKGRGVRVVGRLKQNRWTGDDGKQHSRITIVAEHVEFRPEFGRNSAAGKNDAYAARTGTPPTNAPRNKPASPNSRYSDYEENRVFEEDLAAVVF